MRVVKPTLMLVLLAGLAFAGAVVDKNPNVTIGAADAKLVRNTNGLSISGKVYGVTPGHTFTVWWIIDDPQGSVLVMNATGGLSTGGGEYHFGAGLRAGEYLMGEGNRQVLVNGSLVDPVGATVIFHVLDHGPPISGRIKEQITTFDGGCDTNPQPCPALVAEIIFSP